MLVFNDWTVSGAEKMETDEGISPEKLKSAREGLEIGGGLSGRQLWKREGAVRRPEVVGKKNLVPEGVWYSPKDEINLMVIKHGPS